MSERLADTEASDEARAEVDPRPTAATSRWVSVAGIVVAVLVVLLLVVLHLTGALGPGVH
jgi:hypothetical protein